jgi:hypothetical protein
MKEKERKKREMNNVGYPGAESLAYLLFQRSTRAG